MSRLQRFAKELRMEGAIARKMLERVPNDKYDWKPHSKSMSMRELTYHVATLPAWPAMVLATTELDFAAEPYTVPEIKSTNEIVELLDKSIGEGLQAMDTADESSLSEMWTLRNGETILSKETKEDVIHMSLCQIIHHRAQLGVFLRLLDVPIPGTYGPSADEGFTL